MTTPNDNLKNRLLADTWGEGKEQTVGVPIDGFADPTGEFPKRDYFYGSSINKAARGGLSNEVWRGGGEPDTSVDLQAQPASQYPYNDVQETASGHVMEFDDTPGGERVLIKHRTGAGVEIRADGTVIISSTNNKIEVSGGDHSAIIHGKGDIVYKGSLNLTVTGDYNVNVAGNHNVNVAGNVNHDVYGSVRTNITNNSSTTVGNHSDIKVAGASSAVVLGDCVTAVKGDHTTLVEGDVELAGHNDILITAENDIAISALSTWAALAPHVSIQGAAGVIGGSAVEHYGALYDGPRNGAGEGQAAFIGNMIGRATEATTAEFAQKADYAYFATHATNALAAATSASEGPGGSYDAAAAGGAITTNPDYKMNFDRASGPLPSTLMPTLDVVVAQLAMADYGPKHVTVDDTNNAIANRIKYSDNYQGLIDHIPTTAEIRHILREPNNRSNIALITTLAGEQRISPQWDYKLAPDSPSGNKQQIFTINRTNKQDDPVGRFGYNSIGNNPLDNKSKRFKPSQ